jgi:hypothetical protein
MSRTQSPMRLSDYAEAWSRQLHEGIADSQTIDPQPVLHILAPEARAASFDRSSDDQCIIETKRIPLPQLQTSRVKRWARHQPPERRQNTGEKMARLSGSGPLLQFAGKHGEGFLNDLKTDAASPDSIPPWTRRRAISRRRSSVSSNR